MLEWMKLRLVRQAQTRAGIEWPYRRTLQLADFRQPCTLRGFEFFVEHVRRFTGGHEQITRQPLKITLDLLLGHDGCNPLDSTAMAFSGQPCAFFAVYTFQVEVAMVERGGEVSRGP